MIDLCLLTFFSLGHDGTNYTRLISELVRFPTLSFYIPTFLFLNFFLSFCDWCGDLFWLFIAVAESIALGVILLREGRTISFSCRGQKYIFRNNLDNEFSSWLIVMAGNRSLSSQCVCRGCIV